MAILREDVEAGRVDFSDLVDADARPVGPIHPGRILREEFLEPMGITAYRLAKDIHVPQTRIAEILRGRRSITAETALRLSRYFGMSREFWINLQAHYDLERAGTEAGALIEAEVIPREQLLTVAGDEPGTTRGTSR